MSSFFRCDIDEGDGARPYVACDGGFSIGRDGHIVGLGICHDIGQFLFRYSVYDGDAVRAQVGDVGQLAIGTECNVMSTGTGSNGLNDLIGIAIYDLDIGSLHIGNPYFTRRARIDRYDS